jgi:hypothetical protein
MNITKIESKLFTDHLNPMVDETREESAKTLQAFCRSVIAQNELRIKQNFHHERAQLQDNTEVLDGHGEMIVTKKLGTTFAQVDLETYKKVLKLFHQSHPVKWFQEQEKPQWPLRAEKLRAAVKELDPSLELTFIPRILYELTYIRESIHEDLKKGEEFPYQDPLNPTKQELNQVLDLCRLEQNSWVVDIRTANLKAEKKLQQDSVIHLSYRLNSVFLDLLKKKLNARHFTFANFRSLLEDHLKFFQQLHEDSKSNLAKKQKPPPVSLEPLPANFHARPQE